MTGRGVGDRTTKQQGKPTVRKPESQVAGIIRPGVELEAGMLAFTVDEAEENLLRNYEHFGLYQHGAFLVRVAPATPASDRRKYFKRAAGSLVLHRATTAMIQDIFNRALAFYVTGGGQHPVQYAKDCPEKLAAAYLSRAGLWRLPVLTGFIEAPVLCDDGLVIVDPGYDEDTGILFQSPGRWPFSPSTSYSSATIEDAVHTLLAPFTEFPFATEAERNVIISAIFTGIQRRLLFSAPAHAFDAPAQGSGKSLLADCVAIVVTGRDAVTTSVDEKEEELNKKLLALLVAGDAVVNLDNITAPLTSSMLASCLTLSHYTGRVLGKTETVGVPTNVLILLTGNNLDFRKDMPSRVLRGAVDT